MKLSITQGWNVKKKEKKKTQPNPGKGSFFLSGLRSLRPICYKFVDDEKSKHVVWIDEGEIIRHALFHGFSPSLWKRWKKAALQLGRSFQRPLLSSVTPIDSPIKPVCQDVSPPHKTPSCHSWLQRTYLLCSTLNTALSRHHRALWEYEFPVTWGEQKVTKVGKEHDSRRHKYWIWDWLGNHSNRRGRPRLVHTFFALLCRRSALEKERGTFPRGRIIHCPRSPKEAGAKHKGSGHCHSPQSPTPLKATFQSKTPPEPLHRPLRTGTGQRGELWDASSRRSFWSHLRKSRGGEDQFS